MVAYFEALMLPILDGPKYNYVNNVIFPSLWKIAQQASKEGPSESDLEITVVTAFCTDVIKFLYLNNLFTSLLQKPKFLYFVKSERILYQRLIRLVYLIISIYSAEMVPQRNMSFISITKKR